MKTLVAMKVVPEVDAVRFLPTLNRIVRQSVTSMVNPLDMVALDAALAIRQQHGGTVVAVTMGPPEVLPVLQALAEAGMDRIVHLCDPCFAGADSLATARAMAQAFRREEADLLLCGRSTLDGGTAQTPAQIAELVGAAFVGSAVEIRIVDAVLHGVEEDEQGSIAFQVPLPAVVSVEPALEMQRLASSGQPCAIEQWDGVALGGDSIGYGIRGSRTYVQEVHETVVERHAEVVDCERAVRIIERAQRSARAGTSDYAPRSTAQSASTGSLWVVAEHRHGQLHPASIEGLACAAGVAEQLDAEVAAVLLCDEPNGLPSALAARGADRVLVGTAPELADQRADVLATALSGLVAEQAPLAVIAPWSSRGRHYLPQVAARLELGLTGDFVGLDVAQHPGDPGTLDLVWLKPAWAGNALARVVARTVPALGTLRPGAIGSLPIRDGRGVPVDELQLDRHALTMQAMSARIFGERFDSTVAPVDTAEVVLCVGGAVEPECVESLRTIAEDRGWALAGTAAAVSAGLVSPQCELSIVKRSIAPSVFIGVEVRPQDLACVRMAGVIVTVGAVADRSLAALSDVVVDSTVTDFASMLARPQREAQSRLVG